MGSHHMFNCSGFARRALLHVAGRVPGFLKQRLWELTGYRLARPLYLHRTADVRGRKVHIGPDVHIDRGVRIVADEIEIGAHVRIGPYTKLRAGRILLDDDVLFYGEGRVEDVEEFVVGEYTIFHRGLHVRGHSRCHIGQNCWFGERVFINVHGDVRVANNVGIGQEAMLWTHGFWAEELEGYPAKIGPIIVEENAWLTPRVIVLPDVRIGRNAIVSTGAIVTNDIPPNTLNGGVPCKVIMEEQHYRREHATRDKIRATVAILQERLADRFEIRTLSEGVIVFQSPDLVFCVVTGEENLPEKDQLSAVDPKCDLLFLAPSTEMGAQFSILHPQATVFDYESKFYTKRGNDAERLFKRTLNDRYIRFVRKASI